MRVKISIASLTLKNVYKDQNSTHRMKRLLFYFFTISTLGYSEIFAQDNPEEEQNLINTQDTTWKVGGNGTFTLTQVSLTNWAGGGDDNLSIALFLGLYANYEKDRVFWENNFSTGYGVIKQGEEEIRKSDDKISLSSQFGYQITENNKKLLWSTLFDFRTQYAEGFDFPNDSVLISDAFAPAYINFSVGAEWKPAKTFSLYYSPLSGKFTFVLNQTLANRGAFGVDPAVTDIEGNIIQEGKNMRSEIGTFLKMKYKGEVVKNVEFESKIDLFTNYAEDFGNIDVNWENVVILKVNDFLSANLITQLIYDDDIDVEIDENDDGVPEEVGPRVQFKQLFGVGLNVKF